MSRSHVRFAVVLGSLLASSAAMAGTGGNVDLAGSVDSTLTMSSTTTTGAGTLDLTTAGEKIVKVADITASTNATNGLTLTATSGNLTSARGDSIAFKVTSTAASNNTDPVTADFTTASGTDYTAVGTAAGSYDRKLFIRYTPATTPAAGAYTGSITLTVTDNT